MEFRLLNRLSFQRFVGLRQSSQAPDGTTIRRFKERLIKAGAAERIIEAVNRRLNHHGYVVRGGQRVDAGVVPVPKQTLNKDEKAIVQQDVCRASGRRRSAGRRTCKRCGPGSTARVPSASSSTAAAWTDATILRSTA